MIVEVLVVFFMVFGSLFLLLAAVGLVRMPDLFSRMQAGTKASTLGAGSMVLAAMLFFNDLAITTRAFLVVLFIFVTGPVAAHMIARAAYFTGVPLWENTIIDELRGRYDPETHELRGPAAHTRTGD